MDEETTYLQLKGIALIRFSSIVCDAFVVRGALNFPKSLRIFLEDGSFLEIWISGKKYSYHWERRTIDGTIYRYDNAPHHPKIVTFPHHVHIRTEDNVYESRISNKPEEAIVEVLSFAEAFLKKNQ